ncbi:MAG: C4-type zinc ribbon domain-containing protein [Deltaproteobacteria bacterium]|nr:C4-type zinc ribbon domain-containing protein [Deltaproteobacteria bacterium]
MGVQLKLIVALQKIDSEITRINNRNKMLPGELARLDEIFHGFSADFGEDQKTLEELSKAHKEREEKLKRGVESLKKTKDRLHEVKTNKEYQAMLKEIESTASKNSAIEDEILIVMDKLDQVRKMVKVREKELDGHRHDYESKKRKIEQELAAMDAEVSVYLEKGLMLKEQIASDLLKRYETIKNRSNGLAVVAVWKEICAGCHMNIPPQMYIELQKDVDIQYCPQCNRIIYWEDQNIKGE